MEYLQLFSGHDTSLLEERLKRNKKHWQKNTDEIEHICDYFVGVEKPNYSLSYKEAVKKSKAWVASISKDTTDEVEGVDYEVVYTTDDKKYKFVKLLTETAYKNEGTNMRHCIASYRGRDRIVYSLRDEKNIPHATMDIEVD